MRISVLAAVAALGAGCAPGPPPGAIGPRGGAPATELAADWDDVDPAVRVGLGQTGLAVTKRVQPEAGTIVYHLRTPLDEPAILTVSRLSPEGDEPVMLRLSCTVGRFGDAEREREVLERVRDRLEELHGVEVSPIGR